MAVITHFDLDHVGGWPAISGRVDTVWIGSASGRDERDIALSLAQAGATIQEVTAGDSIQLGDYRLDVLWPVGTGFSDPGNDSSVVVALSAATGCEQCLSGLFLGDLGEKPQRILHGRHRIGIGGRGEGQPSWLGGSIRRSLSNACGRGWDWWGWERITPMVIPPLGP